MDETKGIIFNIQRYSIDDGPGVRTTVFFKGCPLTCLWCSNPESQSPRPEVTWRYTSCKQCEKCVNTCPERAISFVEGDLMIDRQKCACCGKCVDACVQEALSISGKSMTVDEVFKVVKRDYDYYEASGGGVTASGGEILGQADFVAALFKRCREERIGTCADTSGFGDPAALSKILEYSDIVLFDLKHIDPKEHLKACGQSNELIMSNLELAVKSNAKVIIRVPLIPEFNNSDEALSAIAQAVVDRAGGAEVNIMPYHKYGANKYRMIGQKYSLDELRELLHQEKTRAQEVFQSFGLKCEISQ
ncbi:MAG: glycyl-radical enzyme activating protein [Oscillospiraceae bacterium]|nr:glycyl-radical enzyme activating protein [Oscillospiraceae bacterium]